MTASTVVDRPLVLRDGRQVLIRRTEPDDAAAILAYLGRVGGESINLTFGAEGPGFSEEEERAYLTHVATADNSLAIVAVAEGTIVGALTFDGGRRPRLRHAGEFGISVIQAYAGVGLGKALLEYLLAWAERSGVVRKINLKVRVDNLPAIRLYEQMGWVREGRTSRDTLIDGQFADCLLMGREVDPT